MRSRLRRIVLLPTLLLLVGATLVSATPGGVQTTGRQTEDTCTPPGLTIFDDPPGDNLDAVPGHDVLKLSIGEPEFTPDADKLVFTLKMASLAAPLPPNTTWPIWFAPPSGTPRWVAMTTFPPEGTVATPAFLYGTAATAPAINVTTPDGTLDAESSLNVDGTIKLVLSKSTLAVGTGDTIGSFLVRIRVEAVPGVASITPDNMPDDLTPAGSYTLVGNCNPTAVSLTSFRARSEQGRVAVTWRTASQYGVLGFNLWRSGTKVNRTLVAAHGGLAGASYRFVDRAARPGIAYTYRLQTVYRDGTRAWSHSARVVARR